MSTSKSQVTDIEFLSKTRAVYADELSFAGRGLKLIKRDDVKELVDSILAQKVIKVLRLEGNTISPEAAEELAIALQKHGELERFIGNDIFTGRLKDEIPLALKSICGAMNASGANLVEINMSDNAYGPIGLDALVSFFESACCFSLKEIRMHNNGLGPEGAKKFALALEKCFHNSQGKLKLKVFVCGRNRLEFEGAKNISNTLKLIGTLEEIQMPQNGIRPNAIEFIADALSHNLDLKTININDNTLRKIGGEWIAKSLKFLTKLEYINFGDCLLRSKGAVLIARSLAESENLKEVILGFNEINLNAGLEIAKLLVGKNAKTLTLLDLNGNKFGEEGKLEITKILEPVKHALCTLSEDEGSDDEEEQDEDAYDDDEEEEDEEAENDEEVEVVGDEDEDYDQVNDYDEDGEEYDDEEDYDDDEEVDEEDEADEDDEKAAQEKFGNFNIGHKQQEPSLFTNFKLDQLNLNKVNIAQPHNLFSNLVKNNHLMTQIKLFDQFLLESNFNNLKQIDDDTLSCVVQSTKFNGKFLIRFLALLAKLFETKKFTESEVNPVILKIAAYLVTSYLSNEENVNNFPNEILTEFGLLKSEEKQFQPIELSENVTKLFEAISSQSYFPQQTKKNVMDFLNLRNGDMTGASNNPTYKRLSDALIKTFS